MLTSSHRSSAALFVVSFITLVYELCQIRVFAYSLHPLIAFSAIALAMLGFGLGSLAVAMRPRWFTADPLRSAAAAALMLAIGIPAASLLFARTSPFVFPVKLLAIDPIASAVALLPGVVPYALAGTIVTVLLKARVRDAGRAYFWNLAGSAFGCVVAPWAMRHLGAESVMLACGASAAVIPLVLGAARRTRVAAIVAGLAVAASSPWGARIVHFQPDPSDLIYLLAHQSGDRITDELSVWDPVGRIDVVRHSDPLIDVEEPVEYRTITNDSGAMSLMIKPPPDAGAGWGKAIFEQSLYGAAYQVRPVRSVLVIGVGGGTDINAALHWGAQRVIGADVSLATLDALRGPYAEFAAWPRDTRVTLLHEDGRSFAHRTAERFDLVQLTGVDTFTMHSASAMVTAEDVLYTKEAFADFLSVLQPDGMLAVTRYGDESLNLSAIAVAALRRMGVANPQAHIAAIQQAAASGVVVKRSAFTPEEVERLRHLEDRQEPTAVRIPHYDESGLRASAPLQLLHPAGRKPDPRYDGFFAAVATGQEPSVLFNGSVPFVVPTDDRPYYMLGQWTVAGGANHPIIAGVRTATTVIGVGSLSLVALPLLAARRRARGSRGLIAAMVAYFFAIGAAFMLFEVGLIRRTIVFVGSPGAAVSVVMAAILLGASAGAAASERFNRRAWAGIAIPTAGLLGLGLAFRAGAGPLFEQAFALPMWARSVVAAFAIAPGAFFAGWFFPRGMHLVGEQDESLVAWAIGVNAFASVLASLGTLALGVALGFQAVFVIGLGLYLAAGLVGLVVSRRAGQPD